MRTHGRFRVAAIAATIASLPFPLAARAQAPAPWSDFKRLFQAYVDSDKVVGASTIVMKAGKETARFDVGFADRSANVRVDSQTIFHWGSITKSLTAISIMQLRDRGKLSLDDKIVKWVPELRAMHDPYNMMDSITIRMLLSHTAGFQNPTWPYGNDQPWEPFEPTTWNQLVAMMPYQQLLFKPGSKYSYSNPGFVYLARVIEQITGDPWDGYVQKNIFAPLGMSQLFPEHTLLSRGASVAQLLCARTRLRFDVAALDRQRRGLRSGHHVAERRVECAC
jgi:CubicO group peptidase (beta-lactamase class C family)